MRCALTEYGIRMSQSCRVQDQLGSSFIRARLQSDGQGIALQAGNEVLLNYGLFETGKSACECFADYGFVPQELTP